MPTNLYFLLKYSAVAANLLTVAAAAVLLGIGGITLYFSESDVLEILGNMASGPAHFFVGALVLASVPMLLVTKNFDRGRKYRIISVSYSALLPLSVAAFVSL